MQVLRGLGDRPPSHRSTAAAIGNFDGLHLGHQKILRFLVAQAQAADLVPLVLTFSPHPEKVLGGGRIAMIQTMVQRLEGIRGQGVKTTLIVPFSRAFSSLSKEDFAREVIVSVLRSKLVVVGENFRFGRRREGDIGELRRLGREFGFLVKAVSSVVREGRVVSSSLIQAGQVEKAAELLGRPYEIGGRIIRGSERGKSLGIPTANIETANEIAPPGVFLTEFQLGRRIFPSLTNVGRRPTFGCDTLHVESYLFGFRGSAYGRKIRLRFLRKLRPERKYDTPAALVAQIKVDMTAARSFFKRRI
jgi:riboflavin kinase/FMN adenylyltransferase